MDTRPIPVLHRLDKGQLHRLEGRPGRGLALIQGRVWITQDGDPRDVIIDAGGDFFFERQGRVVIEALRDTQLLMLESRESVPEPGRA